MEVDHYRNDLTHRDDKVNTYIFEINKYKDIIKKLENDKKYNEKELLNIKKD